MRIDGSPGVCMHACMHVHMIEPHSCPHCLCIQRTMASSSPSCPCQSACGIIPCALRFDGTTLITKSKMCRPGVRPFKTGLSFQISMPHINVSPVKFDIMLRRCFTKLVFTTMQSLVSYCILKHKLRLL